MNNRLDIIIFGATGVTGKYAIPYLYKFCKAAKEELKWCVAGRSEQKLKDILTESAQRIGVEELKVPIVIADVEDEGSIKEMTASAKVIMNCVGPYVLYGEMVVKACLESRTHYVDVCGEPMFIEALKLKHSKEAEEKGVFIVNACGTLCAASDLGMVYLENEFNGTLNSVEIYIENWFEGRKSGAIGNYATWDSIVHSMGYLWQTVVQGSKLFPKPLPEFKPKLSLRFPLHKTEISGKWAIPFISGDNDIVSHSQRYFYEHEKKRPVQAQCYGVISTLLGLLKLGFYGFIAVILAQFEFGKNLLLNYPEFFSAGYFSHGEPTEDTINGHCYKYTFCGKGWSEKLAEGEDEYKTPPNKEIIAEISGKNPAYRFTCISLTLCAIMILTERKQMPSRGGIHTVAIAYSKTSILEHLQKNGITFNVVSVKSF